MLQLGVAISAVVHTAALAYVVSRPVAARLVVAEQATPIEIVDVPKPAPETAPIEVAMLDAATIAAMEPATAAPPSARAGTPVQHPWTASITARERGTSTTGTSIIEQPGTSEPTPGTSLLSMRRPKVDIELPRAKYDDLEHVPAGTNAEQDLTSGRLAPSGGGRYRSDEGVFVANVGADGSVKFKDSKNFHVHLAVPSVRDLGNGISAWLNDRNKPVGTLAPTRPERIALNNDNLEENFKRPDSGGTVPIVGGGFDVTDAFMRSHGQDPYASRKLAYLDSTRDERVQIGTKHRQQQLAQATAIMQKNLDRMWASVADPAARKQALFELWDECAETGPEELVTAGAEARKLVTGFIRARFPVGSPTAYTADELATVNRRKQSRATFAPYD
jgi:hypothetical protein